MIDRLAVIIAGEYRTWPRVYKYIFDLFKLQANQVDYFFVTWKKSLSKDILDKDVTDYFQSENLIAYQLVEDIKLTHTYYRQNFLIKIGNLLKKEFEFNNDFIYDQVVVTRPDFYFHKSNAEWIKCSNFFYQTETLIRELAGSDLAPENYYLWGQDVYIRSNSATDDIISQKYFIDYHSFNKDNTKFATMNIRLSHHYLIAKFLMSRNLLPLSSKLAHDQSDDPFRQDYAIGLVVREYHDFDDTLDLADLTAEQVRALLYRK